MSFDTCKDVWVFIESFQGQPKSVGLELLGQGRKLADGLKQKLCAIVIGKDVDAAVKESAAYGADKIYVIQGDEYENYSADAYGNVFLKLCEKYDPNTILVGATVNGRDLGSKIAVSLRTGLTADCTALSVEEETGNVVWERPAFGGNLYAQILCSETRPQMGTCRPGAFKKPERNENNKPEIYRNVFKLLVRILDQLTGDAACDMMAPSSYKIRDFIDSNIQANIGLDDIANKFFFSKSYIISCFKNEFGISPKQYIIQKKIETAKNMLLETDMSVKAISEMLHFADSHHFSNTFKKQTGISPMEYRSRTGLG